MSDTTTNTPRILPDLTKAEAVAPAPKQASKGKRGAAPKSAAQPEKATPKKAAAIGKAAPTKAPALKGRARKYADDAKIVVLKKGAPKKNGRDPYSLYRTNMTIAEFIKAGGYRADVPYDIKMGYIKLA